MGDEGEVGVAEEEDAGDVHGGGDAVGETADGGLSDEGEGALVHAEKSDGGGIGFGGGEGGGYAAKGSDFVDREEEEIIGEETVGGGAVGVGEGDSTTGVGIAGEVGFAGGGGAGDVGEGRR